MSIHHRIARYKPTQQPKLNGHTTHIIRCQKASKGWCFAFIRKSLERERERERESICVCRKWSNKPNNKPGHWQMCV